MTKQSTPLSFLFLFLALGLQGQIRPYALEALRQSTFPGFMPDQLEERTTTDTLQGDAFFNECGAQLTAYGLIGAWGTLSGTNQMGDLEKAQLIKNTSNTTFTVKEAWALFNNASVVGNGFLRVKVYSVNPSGGAPEDVLGMSDDLRVNELRVDNNLVLLTIFPFSSPLTLDDESIFLSMDFSSLYASQDTVALLQTNNGCGSGEEAYEKWANNTWHSMRESWSSQTQRFDSNFALFALVEFEDPNEVKDPYIQQGNLRIFPPTPNPAGHSIRLGYELEEAGPVQLEIYSTAGRRLKKLEIGQKASGRHTEEINLADFPAGTYVYSIATQAGRILSRFVVN